MLPCVRRREKVTEPISPALTKTRKPIIGAFRRENVGYEVSGVSLCGTRYRADFRWRNEDGTLSLRVRRMLSSSDYDSALDEAVRMALHDLSPVSDGTISLGAAIAECIASKEGEVSPLTATGYRGSLGKMARALRRIVTMPLRTRTFAY